MDVVWARGVIAVATAIAVLVGAGAGACGPSRSPKQQNQQNQNQNQAPDGANGSTGTPRPTSTEPRPSSERHTDLDVPDGMRPRAIDFVDGFTGYSLFAGCTGGCRGQLFVTFDGGFSWIPRTIPTEAFNSVDEIGMTVVDARTVVLTMGPSAWYRSADTGRTFARGTGTAPAPGDLLRGVGVGCATGGECAPSVLVDGKSTPTQPALPLALRSAAAAPHGPIWAVSADLTTVHTARSDDGGRTWHQVGEPLTVPGTNVLQVSVSLDGIDVWLLASAGPDESAAYYRDPAGWRLINHDVRVTPGIGSAAAAGGGVLAVPGERLGFVFIDGQWSEAARPNGARSARMLPDGTLFVAVAAGDAWLGGGSGAARVWSRVTLDPV